MLDQSIPETVVPQNLLELDEKNKRDVTQANLSIPTKIEASVLARAKKDDQDALATMFRSFIPATDEKLFHIEYLGLQGLWGLGVHSFGCITERRIATIRIAPFKEILYQDGYLEYINGGAILQPSRLWLYIIWVGIVIGSFFLGAGIIGALWFIHAIFGILGFILLAGLDFLLISFATRIYYGLNKCGLLFWIREGLAVYMFTNHNRLFRARNFYRFYSNYRESRVHEIGAPR